mmetsp:Transcript_8899/g.12315  ORF Transcript_8899/g.12315 Transcript_8899/m.12315 type:complete len:241 (-) Transcript_8899:596-1318(-)
MQTEAEVASRMRRHCGSTLSDVTNCTGGGGVPGLQMSEGLTRCLYSSAVLPIWLSRMGSANCRTSRAATDRAAGPPSGRMLAALNCQVMRESQEADTNPSVNARSALTLPPCEPMGSRPRPARTCHTKMCPSVSPAITSPCRLVRAVTRTDPIELAVAAVDMSGPQQVRLRPLTAHHRSWPSPAVTREWPRPAADRGLQAAGGLRNTSCSTAKGLTCRDGPSCSASRHCPDRDRNTRRLW